MSVSRKENGSLVKKAGRAMVDLALSLTSNHAIANRVVTENLNQKVTKFSGTDSGNTYVTVDQLAYDATNKKLGLKVNGADTVIPFSSGGAKLVGTYTSNTTVNVASYGATSASQFLLVPYTDQGPVKQGYAAGPYNNVGANAYFYEGSLSLSGNILTVTLPRAVGAWVINGYSEQGSATVTVACKLYFVGNIS